MKNILIGTFAVMIGVSAQADGPKKAVLNLTCTSAESGKVIKVSSDPKSAKASVDGVEFYNGQQLTGGTEGGDPYLQAVAGGQNLTIQGGDFEKSFNENSRIENGTMSASLWGDSAKYTCNGLVSFKPEGGREISLKAGERLITTIINGLKLSITCDDAQAAALPGIINRKLTDKSSFGILDRDEKNIHVKCGW